MMRETLMSANAPTFLGICIVDQGKRALDLHIVPAHGHRVDLTLEGDEEPAVGGACGLVSDGITLDIEEAAAAIAFDLAAIVVKDDLLQPTVSADLQEAADT